jgi:hypothetical protein
VTSGDVSADEAVVGASSSGASVLVWRNGDYTVGTGAGGPPETLQASYRESPRTAWQRPIVIASAGVQRPGEPQVGVDERGNVITAWDAYGTTRSWIKVP